MNLLRFTADNFRNLKNIDIEFSPESNLITGDNGQGKTNILEAIWLTSGVKSFRHAKENAFFNPAGDKFTLLTHYVNSRRAATAEIIGVKNKLQYVSNGVDVGTSSKLFGNLICIVFSPIDIELSTGAPENRRRFLDIAVSQIKPGYAGVISRYNHLLKQRNAYLKAANEFPVYTEEWDRLLAKYGTFATVYRNVYLKTLMNFASLIYSDIAGAHEKFTLDFLSGVFNEIPDSSSESAEITYFEKLQKASERDYYNKFTSVGIHRDDIAFFINGKSAYAYASQGQMRTIALALKLASAEILKLETSEIPVILLDDVFSELDNTRKEYLTKALPGFQKIITSADEMGGIFIKNGQVVPRGTK